MKTAVDKTIASHERCSTQGSEVLKGHTMKWTRKKVVPS